MQPDHMVSVLNPVDIGTYISQAADACKVPMKNFVLWLWDNKEAATKFAQDVEARQYFSAVNDVLSAWQASQQGS